MTSDAENTENIGRDWTTIFRERFSKLRSEHNMSLATLSKEVGVSAAALSNIEHGALPRLDVAVAIADVFDVSLDWLTGRSEMLSCNIESICDLTGLDKENLENIISIGQYEHDDVQPITEEEIKSCSYPGYLPELIHYYADRSIWDFLNAAIELKGEWILNNCDLSEEAIQLYKTYGKTGKIPEKFFECATGAFTDSIKNHVINEILTKPDFIDLVSKYVRSYNEYSENERLPISPYVYTATVGKKIMDYLENMRKAIQHAYPEYYNISAIDNFGIILNCAGNAMIPTIKKKMKKLISSPKSDGKNENGDGQNDN